MNAIDRSIATAHAVHGGYTSNRAPLTEHQKLVKNTQKWVAQTFYGTMLKEMRKSPFHSDEFEGGREGQAFEEMFDQRLADHMSEGAGSKLVNSVVNRIESRRGGRSQQTNVDAANAYARIMRHQKPVEPPAPDRASKSHAPKPAADDVHRRREKILPEVTHVAPTP